MHFCAKLQWNWSSNCADSIIFRFFKIAAGRYLRFLNSGNLTTGNVQKAEMYHLAKFCQNRSNGYWDIRIFRFFKWQPAAILDFQIPLILTTCKLRKYHMRHHAQISSKLVNGNWDIMIFQFFKMAACGHLWFSNSFHFNGRRVVGNVGSEMHHHAVKRDFYLKWVLHFCKFLANPNIHLELDCTF